jgi:hypothetical protein
MLNYSNSSKYLQVLRARHLTSQHHRAKAFNNFKPATKFESSSNHSAQELQLPYIKAAEDELTDLLQSDDEIKCSPHNSRDTNQFHSNYRSFEQLNRQTYQHQKPIFDYPQKDQYLSI